jgi:gamma-glutamyltranspeptidase / glutathione hydrolase
MKTSPLKIVASLLICSIAATGNFSAQAAFPRPSKGRQGMVAAAHPLATQIGLNILRQGGNAVDAAVATTLAISVVEPFSAGIGGGGFLLVQNKSKIQALDFRERAPQAASRNMYLDTTGKVKPKASLEGHLSAGIPGTVAGLVAVHRQYGKLPWAKLVQPAIELAKTGFVVSDVLADQLRNKAPLLQKNRAASQIFLPKGQPLQTGEQLVQTDLAQTLTTISRDPQDFYQGNIAKLIAADMRNNSGIITTKDLQNYRSIWRDPLCGKFRQYQVCSMPPPSSGGVHLLQMLNILGDTDLVKMGWHSPDALHLLAETMRIAYADRSYYLGDPAFVQVPVIALTSLAYGALRRQEISPTARPSSQVRPADWAVLRRFQPGATAQDPIQKGRPGTPKTVKESQDTSHLTVVDRDRQVVTLTFTVNYNFGSGVVVPGTGILLNDEMDDFAVAPGVPNAFGLVGGEANAVAPGKTPLSSMSPTIVTENDQLRLALGAPGGSTIITTVLQIILNNLVYKMNVAEAVAAGRMHQQWSPDKLSVDRWGFDAGTLAELTRRGHNIEPREYWGNANAIEQLNDGTLQGAADPRKEGTAAGF